MDEVDAYPPSASTGAAGTEEGDPVDLAIRRTGDVRQPADRDGLDADDCGGQPDRAGVPGVGPAEVLRAVPALRRVPDPALGAGEMAGPEARRGVVRVRALPRARSRTTTSRRCWSAAEWRAEAPGDGETAGFWLNGLYSPWTTWGQLAKDFLRARKSPERMQTFTNTVLAETFQQAGATKTDAGELLGAAASRTARTSMLPAGVVLITLGADLQADRIELEIVGWGRDEESWSLAYIVLPGDPAQRDLWDAFDQVLSLQFDHPCGRELEIAVACVDSGFPPAASCRSSAASGSAGAAAPKMYPDQGRGRPASDLAAHAQQGERQSPAVGDRRGRRQGGAVRAAEDHGAWTGLLPLSDQRPVRPGLLRAAYGRDVPGAVHARASRIASGPRSRARATRRWTRDVMLTPRCNR